MYFQLEKCFEKGKESLYELFEPKKAFRKKLRNLNFYTAPRSYHSYFGKEAVDKKKCKHKKFHFITMKIDRVMPT